VVDFGGRQQFREQGFTLIEILIVVLFIGLISGVIALTLGDKKSESAPRTEAQLLMQTMGFAAEYAVLNGELMALFIFQRDAENTLGPQWCYRWKRQRDNLWDALPDDALPEHCMAEGVQWDLSIEGKPYSYDPSLEHQPPILLFSPSGETTAAEMAIFEQGATVEAQHIDLDLMGNSHWRNEDEATKDGASKEGMSKTP